MGSSWLDLTWFFLPSFRSGWLETKPKTQIAALLVQSRTGRDLGLLCWPRFALVVVGLCGAVLIAYECCMSSLALGGGAALIVHAHACCQAPDYY